MEDLIEIKKLCDNKTFYREVSKKSEQLAKEKNCIIIVGGSDDLMYCYGADSYLTEYTEHSYGWGGDTLVDISDKKLEAEAKQLGLMIFEGGVIKGTNHKIDGYDSDKSGAFSYTVNDNIKSLDFKVMEDTKNVYCTGKIIKLPLNFKISN